MKKTFLTALQFIVPLTICFCQDILTTKTGEDVLAKIIEVGHTEIKYKKFDNQDGPVFTLLRSDVLMIRYENGTKDIFTEVEKKSTPAESDLDPYPRGQLDALRYYDGYKGAGTGTLIVSLLSPLVGLIPAIACSSTPPKDKNLMYPNSGLMKNSDYYRGYTSKARKVKSRKVWRNWLIAFGVNLVLVLALGSN